MDHKRIELTTARFFGMSKVDFLTPKEREICIFLREGKTANEIAKTLGLSIRTVEFYTDNIKAKFECGSKLELVVLLNKIIK